MTAADRKTQSTSQDFSVDAMMMLVSACPALRANLAVERADTSADDLDVLSTASRPSQDVCSTSSHDNLPSTTLAYHGNHDTASSSEGAASSHLAVRTLKSCLSGSTRVQTWTPSKAQLKIATSDLAPAGNTTATDDSEQDPTPNAREFDSPSASTALQLSTWHDPCGHWGHCYDGTHLMEPRSSAAAAYRAALQDNTPQHKQHKTRNNGKGSNTAPIHANNVTRMMLVRITQHHVTPTTAMSKMIAPTILPATGATT